MPGLANTLLGRTQKTFRLLTEETAQKWRFPAQDVDTAANQFDAGAIVKNTSTGLIVVTTSGVAAGEQVGVAMENHTPTLNEIEGSGLAAVVVGPHMGQTKKYDGAITDYAPGAPLYASNATAGNFSTTETGVQVAIVVARRGDWLEYQWVGPNMDA